MGLTEFVTGVADKLGSTIDRVQGYAADTIVRVAQPAVHSEIDQRVDNFRDAALSELPRQTEEGLRSKVANGPAAVAWVFDKVLGDNTDQLVSSLVERFRPGITSATDGLSTNATQAIMDKLKDLLDGRDPETGVQETPPVQVQGDTQAQNTEAPPEQQSRGLFTPSPTGEVEGDGTGGLGGFGAAAAGLAGQVFRVDSKLPAFEDAARQLVHPLFEKLKTQVWELVPAALQDALAPLVGEKQDEVEANPQEAGVADDSGSNLSRGLGSWVQNKLSGNAGVVLDKVIAATLDAVDGPLQALIGRLVDELESSATEAAFLQVRAKLAQYKLISSA